ncbi:MAG: Fe-S cluster assembly ATPase SufC [Chitinophagales bacterium]|nr:Fe-S cluster assembly ATPase SufC [Chitinophagales bacterium]MDW8419868.1 Fe-S cluster assembly ATPase SufC [Chitinophagales bacterium]
MQSMLSINHLTVAVNGKEILRDFSLTINPGEVHAIMGPNGTGKSTLAATLAGREEYEVVSGEILYKGRNLLEMEADERAREGIFLAFQYPVEIPGVSTTNFMKAAVNAKRKHQGLEPLDAREFLKLMNEKAQLVDIKREFLSRSINEGFSGGEKKRNEIFQMAMLEPSLCILDETDSGLDIDALRIVANGVNRLRSPERSFLVITHYQRLLNYIIPDYVHVLFDGRIAKSGGKELALKLEAEGYDWVKEELVAD